MIASQSDVSEQVRGSNTRARTVATLHLHILSSAVYAVYALAYTYIRAQLRQGAINALPVNVDGVVWSSH